MRLSNDKISSWKKFFELVDLTEELEAAKKAWAKSDNWFPILDLDDTPKAERIYPKDELPLEFMYGDISMCLVETPEARRIFKNYVFIEYNTATPYSTKKSKEVILGELTRLQGRYGDAAIPLFYTTFKSPNYFDFPSEVRRDFRSAKSFKAEDYGNLDFMTALAELEEDKIISIPFYDLVHADNDKLVFRVVVQPLVSLAKRTKPENKPKEISLFTSEAKIISSAGDLVAYSDGTIRFEGADVRMRNQLKDLCRLFMSQPGRLFTIDDIKENLIPAKKRSSTPNITIAKYVSELRNILFDLTKKNHISNQKEEGWVFTP